VLMLVLVFVGMLMAMFVPVLVIAFHGHSPFPQLYIQKTDCKEAR